MAPSGNSNWRRPYTSIYNDNYRYGTGLYADTLTDIEKRYTDSISRTQLRADRGDIGLSTFAGSALTAADLSVTPDTPTPVESRIPLKTQLSFEHLRSISPPPKRSDISAKAASALSAVDEVLRDKPSIRPKSLYDDSAFWSSQEKPDVRELRTKKSPSNGPGTSQWREKSRVLQEQVESLESSLSSCEGRLQAELSSLQSKYKSEVSDLSRAVEETSQQAQDLQRLTKTQAQRIRELESAYETSQRNVSDALEEMSIWQNKCSSIKRDMSRLREEVEQAIQRRSKD